MTPRSLVQFRQHPATRTAAVTMGLLTAAGALAPAALADEPTDAAPTTGPDPVTTPEETSQDPAVLTPSPTPTGTPDASLTADSPTAQDSTPATTTDPAPTAASELAVPPGAVHYGTGKIMVGLDSSDDLPATLDRSGAQLQLTFTGGAAQGATSTCTFVSGMCTFPLTAGLPTENWFGPVWAVLPENSAFTITMVKAPNSGQLLLDPAAPPAIVGYTTTDDDPDEVAWPDDMSLAAPSGYRTLGVSVQSPAPLAGSVFSLCTIPGSDCSAPLSQDSGDPGIDFPGGGSISILRADEPTADSPVDDHGRLTATTDGNGLALFAGTYVPGSYTVVQTAAPGGRTFDASPHQFVVDPATSVAERNTPALLTLGTPPSVATPSSTPAPSSSGTPTSAAPVTSVASPRLAAGKQQTISLGGFQPGETVHGVLHSDPVDLGTVQADANGVATFTFTVPAGLESGTHTVSMSGLTSGVTGEASFTVTAASGAGSLAYTGTDVLPLLAAGGALLVGGAGAVTLANRRRRSA